MIFVVKWRIFHVGTFYIFGEVVKFGFQSLLSVIGQNMPQ